MKVSQQDKNNFIQIITSMNREQIAKFIRDKGKEPKKIKPFVILNQ